MNANVQKSLDYIEDDMRAGRIDSDEANIRFIEAKRFTIIVNKIPSKLRKALNSGVKQGRLVRVKKTEKTPEYYYKKNFEYLAKEEISRRNRVVAESLKAILGN